MRSVPSSTVGAREERWWTLTVEQAAAFLHADLRFGLSSDETDRRLAEVGPNELEEKPPKSPWLMLLEQFANTMIVVLLAAAAITAALGDVKDTVVIAAIVVLNAAIGFTQEYRAERAMAALKRMTAPLARVVRDGTPRTVPAREVVPGDLVLLEAGDVVPADARLVEAPNLRVNEAPLTGESVPVDKSVEPITREQGEHLPGRRNMVFKGTPVTYGRARAVVTATGMGTALGHIAGLLQAHRAPRTPLQRRLATLGQRLAAAAVVVCVVVFTVGVARGEPVSLMFLTAVSLAVAAIPEALPAVVTVALALGAQRMARQHALVRKLPAVETLGSVTVACSDKTGTLTQGRMQVERVWTAGRTLEVTGSGYEPEGQFLTDGAPVDPSGDRALGELLRAAALCNDATLVPPEQPGEEWAVTGDPTEAALLVLAAKAGLWREHLDASLPRLAEVPFDSDRKRMTTLHGSPGGDVLLAAKGAPEVLLPTVAALRSGEGQLPLSPEDLAGVREAAAELAEAGYRILAIAGGRLPSVPDRPERAERDLVLLGLVAMADPPRPESEEAVAACRRAGILPVMVTGDHPATARAVARRLGILDQTGTLMTGMELSAEGAEGLAGHVADVSVYARTAPEQKLDIVEAWKARGDIVAMTGDGVNDAPALRRADIGVAMGIAGTEVSKEAADMVLTDDNFATIVAAVREGRRIYDNIRRFIRYMLTANSGEIWVMLLGPFVGLPLPLLPLQILWINLVTDALPAIGLGMEQAEPDAMRRPPRPPAESLFARGLWQRIVFLGLLMGAIPLAIGVWGRATGRPWQTMVFTSLALLQLGQTLAVRADRESAFALGVRTNPFLIIAVLATALLQIGILYWAPMQGILSVEPLAVGDLWIVLAASTGVFWAVELEKLVRRRGGH